jgi:acyl carrier protein
MENEVKAQLREFVSANYMFGEDTRAPVGDHSLLGKGMLDSTGFLGLVKFPEERYGIAVSETENVPGNLDTIANLTRFALDQTRVPAGAASFASLAD